MAMSAKHQGGQIDKNKFQGKLKQSVYWKYLKLFVKKGKRVPYQAMCGQTVLMECMSAVEQNNVTGKLQIYIK